METKVDKASRKLRKERKNRAKKVYHIVQMLRIHSYIDHNS